MNEQDNNRKKVTVVGNIPTQPTAVQGGSRPVGFNIQNFIDSADQMLHPSEIPAFTQASLNRSSTGEIIGEYHSGNRTTYILQDAHELGSGQSAGTTQNGLTPNTAQPVMHNVLVRQPRAGRRAKTHRDIIVDHHFSIKFIQFYKTGLPDKLLLANIQGPIDVSYVDFMGLRTAKDYYLVQIGRGETMVRIFLETGKECKGKDIYTQCIKAGIFFNPDIRDEDIMAALKDFMTREVGRIPDDKVSHVFPYAGWDEEMIFHSKETTPRESLPENNFPVSDKSFLWKMCPGNGIDTYFNKLKRFENPLVRLIVMVAPFLGLCYSLFERFGQPRNLYLNIIPEGKISQGEITAWMQIFNRSKVSVYDGNITTKHLQHIVTTCKDEVLIFDCRKEGTSYTIETRRSRAEELARAVRENGPVGGCQLMSLVALLSSEFRPGAINLPWPTFDATAENSLVHLRREYSVETVLSGMIEFISTNPRGVETLFLKKRELPEQRLMPIAVILDILDAFFTAWGYADWRERLELPPVEELMELLDNSNDSDEDRLRLFVRTVRKEVEGLTRYSKRYGCEYHEDGFYCDDDRIFFPVPILRQIFQNNHCESLLDKVLSLLRSQGKLITNRGGSGFTNRNQIGGKQTDFYVFSLEVFNRTGLANIIDLAKEVIE